MKTNKPWFGPRVDKTFGTKTGSGLGSRPITYQGWLVVLAYLVLALLMLVNVRPLWLAIGVVIILTLVENIIERRHGGTFWGNYLK